MEMNLGKHEGRLIQAQNFDDLFFWRPKDLHQFWPHHLRNVWFRKEGEKFIRIDAAMKGEKLEVKTKNGKAWAEAGNPATKNTNINQSTRRTA